MNAIMSLAIARLSDYLIQHTQVVRSDVPDVHNVVFRKWDSRYRILIVVNDLGSNAETHSVSPPNVRFPAGLMVVDVLT